MLLAIPLAFLACVFLMSLIGASSPVSDPVSKSDKLLVSVVFVAIPGTISIFLVFLSGKLGQRAYDADAINLFRHIDEGSTRTFFVYLRPFYVTNKLVEAGFFDPFSPLSILKDTDFYLESQLVKAMKQLGPIVGLGRPGESLGVGRILTTEYEWKQNVAKLLVTAKIIFCIPSTREGTLWEVSYVIENRYLSKTIFVMPPTPTKGVSDRKKFELADDWSNICTIMNTRSFLFPTYHAATQEA